MKIFKPNFLAVLFSVKIKSFEFRLYDYDCLFILNKQSTVIKYSEINSFEEAKQTIWTTLSIKLKSGLIIQLHGLNEFKISVLKESIQKKIRNFKTSYRSKTVRAPCQVSSKLVPISSKRRNFHI